MALGEAWLGGECDSVGSACTKKGASWLSADRVMRLNVVREPRVRSPAQQARAWNNKKEEYQAFLLSYDLVPPPLPWWRA